MSLIKVTSSTRNYIRYGLSAAVLFGVTATLAGACTTDCSIDVYFTGKYADETCDIAIDNGSNNETVTLPDLPVSALKNDGEEAGQKQFTIALKNCPAGRTIALSFNSSASAADTATGNLVNATGGDYSQNVEVRLRKENGTQTVIDDASTGQDYVIATTEDPVSHQFTASYYAKGNSAVTAGNVHTTAGIELTYK